MCFDCLAMLLRAFNNPCDVINCIIIIQVEWLRPSVEEGADNVIVYAVTDDYAGNMYQSSKAVQSDLYSSTEVNKYR